jgi:hypothetical protein
LSICETREWKMTRPSAPSVRETGGRG